MLESTIPKVCLVEIPKTVKPKAAAVAATPTPIALGLQKLGKRMKNFSEDFRTDKKAWKKEIEILYEEIGNLREEIDYLKNIHEEIQLNKEGEA